MNDTMKKDDARCGDCFHFWYNTSDGKGTCGRNSWEYQFVNANDSPCDSYEDLDDIMKKMKKINKMKTARKDMIKDIIRKITVKILNLWHDCAARLYRRLGSHFNRCSLWHEVRHINTEEDIKARTDWLERFDREFHNNG